MSRGPLDGREIGDESRTLFAAYMLELVRSVGEMPEDVSPYAFASMLEGFYAGCTRVLRGQELDALRPPDDPQSGLAAAVSDIWFDARNSGYLYASRLTGKSPEDTLNSINDFLFLAVQEIPEVYRRIEVLEATEEIRAGATVN